MLERLKSSASRVANVARSPCFVRWSPAILVLLVVAYLLIGATSFYLFERNNHEIVVRKWYTNLAFERRQFAKSISARIFNDTRNLLIIIDREQTERVQQLLVESLKRYEDKLEITPPSRREWTFLASFNYAYSLLLTVGSGWKVPKTPASQVFSVIFALIGIPLFYTTLFVVVYRLIGPILKASTMTLKRRLLMLQLIVLLYILWAVLLALCLYYQAITDFWESVFYAFASSLTIQRPNAMKISSCGVLFLQLASTVSVSFVLLMLLIVAATYFPRQVMRPIDAPPLAEKTERLTPPPKFTVIVDEAGESRLTAHVPLA